MRLMLKVKHEGQDKFVGKIFGVTGPDGKGEKHGIFFHETKYGDQWHRNLDSPGGVDVCVLDYLQRANVKEVHHHDKKRHTLYVATVADMMAYGVKQVSDGRERIYLPHEFWENYPVRWYIAPFVRDVHTLSMGVTA